MDLAKESKSFVAPLRISLPSWVVAGEVIGRQDSLITGLDISAVNLSQLQYENKVN